MFSRSSLLLVGTFALLSSASLVVDDDLCENCKVCLKKLAQMTRFCDSKEENGLRVFFENRTHDKRNHVLDFYHHQNQHGEEKTDTKRLMRATVDESGKMNCTCPRLSNSKFMASRSGEVCLVFRASARQLGDPVEAAASALRKSLVKACPDEEQRMQAFYVKERQFAAREGQGAGVEVQPVMPVTSSTMRHVKPQSKKMSTTVERRGQLVHSSKRLN